MRRRAITIALVLITAGAVLALTGCPSTIVPPVDPVDPVSVFLIDAGRHASLALPSDDDESALVEYSYGDWNWYALDESAWYDTFPTLLWPTQGALGRRPLPVEPSAESVQRYVRAEMVLEIVVSGAAADALLSELDRRFEGRSDTAHYQPLYDLTFVHTDGAFHAFHNCNHVVADWLRACGCDVRGATVFANFEVRKED